MRFGNLLLFACLAVVSARPSPRSGHVVHEYRESLPSGWERTKKLEDHVHLPFSIGLKQNNMDDLEDHLLRVSDPASPYFAQHWTPEQVRDQFAPSEETIATVRDWLMGAGFDFDRIRLTKGKGWMEVVNMTVGEANALLDAEYHVHTHSSGRKHIACDSYSVPKHVQQHIDIVLPAVSLGAETPNFHRRSINGEDVPAKEIGKVSEGPKKSATISAEKIIEEIEQCGSQITPICLQALYKFPVNEQHATGKNSYGIVEYTPQSYLPTDLDMFFGQFATQLVGHRPKMDSIDGGNIQTEDESFDYNGESDLDLEYAMTLVYPLNPTLYQTGDMVEGASFNNFLDAIDGTYCTYEGGDDPTQDGIYPDYSLGGYTGPESCGTFKPTSVISTSYGYNEADLTPFYEQRQCNEYAKLGLQGVSILYSSGDYGVAGNDALCLNPDGSQTTNGTRFNPSFPGTCPYVTSVGATQIVPNGTIFEPEEACETVIYSGGGFSNVFPMPSYQSEAVKKYKALNEPLLKQYTGKFNDSEVRGFPDVAANGANYVIAIDGEFALVYGTSASSPTFGSIVTLINDARLATGKKPIGFLNPSMYANPFMFNDITKGSNQGCGTEGFYAVPGWDPVTGLGTPDYLAMVAYYLTLP